MEGISEVERRIEWFAAKVIAKSFDDGVDGSLGHARTGTRGLETTETAFQSLTLDRMIAREKLIAVAAAEGALATLFSIAELSGSFKIAIRKDDGSYFDLESELGAPMISMFLEAGWLETYSKYADEVRAWALTLPRNL